MAATSSGTLCASCMELELKRSDFTSPPFEPEGRYNSVIRTGTLRDLHFSKEYCKLCELIWYALERNEGPELLEHETDIAWSMLWRQSTDEWCPTEEDTENLYGSALYPQLDIDGSNCNYGIQLIDRYETREFLRGRILSHQIDIGLIKSWLRRCNEDHGLACAEPTLSSDKPHPATEGAFTVIDVDRLCLCDLPPSVPYVALSYVWGRENAPVALTTNFERLMQPGELASGLPATLTDSMDLVKVLGFRFLWVDSLCITQDDAVTKDQLIPKMDKIYADAYFVIVAASGTSAQSGLSGYRENSRARLAVRVLGPDIKVGILPFFDREMIECAHAKRAWTYQETCLSRRCLVFLNGAVYFRCREMLWAEHTMAEIPGITPMDGANTLGTTASEWPLRRYLDHVYAYSSRQLTYQSDGLNAFSGISSALSSAMQGPSMLFGMPVSVFDWAILWAGHGVLERRRGFPSWAWVGWKGLIMMAQDTYNLYDEKWLLTGTWIDWFEVDRGGQIVRLWDPARDHCIVSPLAQTVREFALDSNLNDKTGARPKISEDDIDHESLGEGIEEEDELCPTYGWVSLSDAYGRTLHPSISAILPADTSSAEFMGQHCDAPFGTIYFSTLALNLLIHRAPRLEEPTRCHILDSRGKACGYVRESRVRMQEFSGYEHCTLLLLSVASFGILSMARQNITALDPPYQRGGIPREDELPKDGLDLEFVDYFNIMLIRPCNFTVHIELHDQTHAVGAHERAGLGLIHRDALAHGDSQWKHVFLV